MNPTTEVSTTPAPHLLEEGAAFAALSHGHDDEGAEAIDVLVIGAGQSGLSVGHHLARRGIPFLILDAHARVGDVWRERWDSLRLFSPAKFNGLDGLPFPAPANTFPTKDAMADYLEDYARHFQLPVRTGTRVDGLRREGDRYVVTAGSRRFVARHVVVAMATYQQPRVPAFAAGLDPGITQLHSRDYRRPSQIPAGGVLIVGAGNSGAEIAIELAHAGHPVWVSGRDTGQVPFKHGSPIASRVFIPILFRVIFHRLLTVDTPPGRAARPAFVTRGTPLIRTRTRDLLAAGVTRVARMQGVQDGKPRMADGQVLDVNSVVWCTGYHAGADWIALPVLDDHGDPRQVRGVVPDEPGLYFVGTEFLYAVSSAMIHGVGRDAARVADTIATRLRVAA